MALFIGMLFKLGLFSGPPSLSGLVLLPLNSSISDVIGQFFAIALLLNLVLGLFNLIPLAPLDGSKVALGLLPKNIAYRLARFEHYGPRILMGIIMLDIFGNTGIIARIIDVPMNILQNAMQ